VKKWSGVALTERSAAQQHFLDLCALTGHPTPAEADPEGEWFTFERGAGKSGGGDGFADVWKRGFFAIEYKGRHKDLDKACPQILLYREALENPPLLAVCDLDRIIIHPNFTATAKKVHLIELAALPEPRNLEILRDLFHAPDKLRPGATSRAITEQAAASLGEVALSLRGRGLEAAPVACFVDRIVFCLFAEDVALLPDNLFTNLFAKTHGDPPRLKKLLDQLFQAMAEGGEFAQTLCRSPPRSIRSLLLLVREGPGTNCGQEMSKCRPPGDQSESVIFGQLQRRPLRYRGRSLDGQSKLIGVSRQSLIKLWIAERLQQEQKSRKEMLALPVSAEQA